MIGRRTSRLEAAPRRWLHRWWGVPEIHTRQKWSVIWPHLERLPAHGLRVLDAGCGHGRWALEVAARRPKWRVEGIDVDPRAIAEAERAQRQLGLRNLEFRCVDFLDYTPSGGADVVLAVASLHYLAESEMGPELFAHIRSWLVDWGRLILLTPRHHQETSEPRWGPRPTPRTAFTVAALYSLCGGANLAVERLVPVVGPLGVLAKQLQWMRGQTVVAPVLAIGTYPLQLALAGLDRIMTRDVLHPSLMLLLIARARPQALTRVSASD